MDEPVPHCNRLPCAILVLGLIVGCEGIGGKVKDPVVPPPPRRISQSENAAPPKRLESRSDESVADDVSEIDTAEGGGWKKMGRSRIVKTTAVNPTAETVNAAAEESETTPPEKTVISRGEVAAVVNGQPIFIDDVIIPATPQLKQAREELSPSDYRKLRRMFAEKFVQSHIEQELLLQALKRKLKPEQFEAICKGLNKQVDDDLRKQMKGLGVSTIGELEVELRKSGLSVEDFRQKIRNQKMAEQYLSAKVMPREGFDRPDLLAYYKDNIDKYKNEARVRWQQIELSPGEKVKGSTASKMSKQLASELKNGADFDELARKYSSGPTAEQGGVRDWTSYGSLAYNEVNDVLAKLPVGAISDPIAVRDGFWIVKILDKEEESFRSFEDVQDSIKDDIRRQQFSESVKALIGELRESSEIWLFPEG